MGGGCVGGRGDGGEAFSPFFLVMEMVLVMRIWDRGNYLFFEFLDF